MFGSASDQVKTRLKPCPKCKTRYADEVEVYRQLAWRRIIAERFVWCACGWGSSWPSHRMSEIHKNYCANLRRQRGAPPDPPDMRQYHGTQMSLQPP